MEDTEIGGLGASAPAAPAADPEASLQGADPRLLRLTQRRGVAGNRGMGEAMVVQRRRHRSPPGEQEQEGSAARPLPVAAAPGQDVGGALAEAAEEQEEDDETTAARRMAIRARQLAAGVQAAAASEEEEGSDDSSEYTTDDSDDNRGGIMLKPAFVPKTERETLVEREALLSQAEQTTRQEADQMVARKRQTQELVIQAQLQEAQQEAPAREECELETDDENDEVAQYEAWREREMARIARDRQVRQAGTKAEAAVAASGGGLPTVPTAQSKKKWKFLQEYWHKGAFFQTEEEMAGEDVLGDVMRREYDAPTGEDKFDKQMLPKIMQVRNFGRRGRTKWSHLLAEDTTFASGGGDAPLAAGGRQPGNQQAQDFSKPRSFKT